MPKIDNEPFQILVEALQGILFIQGLQVPVRIYLPALIFREPAPCVSQAIQMDVRIKIQKFLKIC